VEAVLAPSVFARRWVCFVKQGWITLILQYW